MTPFELRALIAKADVYKMSLGKSSRYEKEALSSGNLVFQSEAALHEAVLNGDKVGILKAGSRVKNDKYPQGGADEAAIRVWQQSIETFRSLPRGALIVHWEADLGHLHWGLTGNGFFLARKELGDWGQPGMVFHRPLQGGWRKTSVAGVLLTGLHPSAKNLSINRATLNRVQTHPDYFRALLADTDTTTWEALPDWKENAAARGWIPKDKATILAHLRKATSTPLVTETADFFDAEVKRMASTALQTAAYANGQTVITTVKGKDCGFTRDELEAEIYALLEIQEGRCALTGFEFKPGALNPHLRSSLDRKDSNLGYVPGNLQVVTRAANFYKSASDEADWDLKAKALEKMAIAMQQRRKAGCRT